MSAKSRGKGKEKASKDKNKRDKSSKKDGKYSVPRLVELESNFLLRMPEPFASNLQEALENGGLKDRLQVEFKEDGRKARVVFDGVTFSATLLDLPCIIESWKTFDKKSMWKTGDVCQMLVCRDPEEPSFSSDEEENSTFDYFKKRLNDVKKYQYPHGITEPLKNVRKRRFRKTAKQKYVDAPEIEKEVKRLLRADVSAVNVSFDVIDDQEKAKPEELTEDIDVDVDVGGPSIDHFDENSNMSSIMMDASDSEQPPEAVETPVGEGEGGGVNILPDISSSEDEGDGGDGVDGGLENLIEQRAQIQQQLRDIQGKIHEQETRVSNAANPFLKQRFQSVLNEMQEQERSLQQQFANLS